MSGRIPQSFIDDLLGRVDIVQVIDARVALKKAGGEYKACCPFHNEKTPSFTVSPSKQFYHCFGCGAHGSAIGFLIDYERLEFVEVIELLARDLGLEVPREGGAEPDRPSMQPLLDVLARCADLYRQELAGNPAAQAYLQRRGLDASTADRFGLGYAPGGWDWLIGRFGGSEAQRLEQAGMLSRNERGKVYDRFRERLMFPITDRRGQVIAFGGRVIGEGAPKYLNSPETPLFHKGRELYGLYQARQASNRPQRLLVVEGYMDVIALWQHGVEGAVATLGTATTDEHLQQLFRQVGEIVFCFDGDEAGRRAAAKALDIAIVHLLPGREARFLFLPQGEDPDSLVRREGRDAFERRAAQALPLADYLFESLCHHLELGSEAGRAALVERFRPIDARIPKTIYAGLLRDRLAALVRISRQEIDAALGGAAGMPIAALSRRRLPGGRSVGMTPMRLLIALLLKNPELAQRIANDEALLTTDEPGMPLLRQLLDLCRTGPTPGALLESFRGHPQEAVVQKLFAWQAPVGEESEIAQAFDDALAALRRSRRRQRREALILLSRQRSLSADEKLELQSLFAAAD